MGKRPLDKKIIVTGGGSGGHVSAALSIISSLQEKYVLNSKNFLYVGGDLGMEGEKPGNSLEQRIMKEKDFNSKYIRAGKLQRNFSLNTVRLIFRSFLGFWDSYKIVKKFRPDIVMSTGGFVTVHVCLIAKLFKAQIYLHEQTSTVGLTNKIVGKVCEKIFISFSSSKRYFPEKKTVLTGNLVRQEIFNTKGQTRTIQKIKEMQKNSELPIIYISGGGLGSHVINSTVKEALGLLLQKYQIILQCGDNRVYKDFDVLNKVRDGLEQEKKEQFFVVKYLNEKEIGYVLNNTDLYVGRAGANTVYELGVLQIPSIFIPIPWVTRNEQYENAKVLEDLGLAEILNEGELTGESLVLKIDRFITRKRDVNKEKIKEVFKTNANELILKNIGI